MEILLLSDNHAYLDEDILRHASEVDQIWHAGDWLSVDSADQLLAVGSVRGVFGNVDGHELRTMFPEENVFEIDGLKVLIRHIGGYPGKYNERMRSLIERFRPHVVICGHSHILKVVKDKKYDHIHLNPGAIGKKGFHQVRTMLRFTIENGKISNLRVLEYEK